MPTFPGLDHSAFIKALQRSGLHPQYVDVIRDMYDGPD